MKNFSLLDQAIEQATRLLYPNAKFRLKDILVEEISFVDYPANNHKFLVVKRNATKDKPLPASLRDKKMEKQAPKCEEKMLDKTKEAIAKSITDALTRLTAFATVLKETPESEDTVLPSDLGKELSGVATSLAKTFFEHGVAKASDEVIQTVEALVQIAEMSMMLAEETAVSGEVSDETSARMKQMSGLLDILLKGEEEEGSSGEGKEEGTGDPPKIDDPEKATASPEGESKEGEEGEPEGGGEAPKIDDESKSAEGEGGGGESTEPSEDKSDLIIQSLDRLTSAVTDLVELQTKSVTEPSTEKKEEEESKEDELQKKLDAFKEENAQLKKKLEKATEEPPKRASHTQVVDKGTTKTKRIFPLVYNDPLHDPDVEVTS